MENISFEQMEDFWIKEELRMAEVLANGNKEGLSLVDIMKPKQMLENLKWWRHSKKIKEHDESQS